MSSPVALDAAVPDAAPVAPRMVVSAPCSTVFAIDADYVYWLDWGGAEPCRLEEGRLLRVPKAGGARVVLASDQYYPTRLALDETHVYWLTYDSVQRARKDGSERETIATGQPMPDAIALDDSYVYWASHYGDSLVRAPKTGGAIAQLAKNGDCGEGRCVLGTASIALDDKYIYWSADPGLVRLPRDGGSPVVFNPGAGQVELFLDSEYLYWLNTAVRRQHREGELVGVLFEPPETEGGPTGPLVVSGNDVFWAFRFDVLYRGDLGTAGWGPIVTHTTVDDLAVDGQSVYWLSGCDRAILVTSRQAGEAPVVGTCPWTF